MLRDSFGLPILCFFQREMIEFEPNRKQEHLALGDVASFFNYIENILLNSQKVNIKKKKIKNDLPLKLISQYHNANIWLLNMQDGCFEMVIDFVVRCSVHCSDIADDISSPLALQLMTLCGWAPHGDCAENALLQWVSLCAWIYTCCVNQIFAGYIINCAELHELQN